MFPQENQNIRFFRCSGNFQKRYLVHSQLPEDNLERHAKIVKTDQNSPSVNYLEEAAEIIRSGGLVVFPTETVYGLGASAFSSSACLKIFQAKNRPPDNPLIVHVSSFRMLYDVVDCVPADLIQKLRQVWPGPVTVLFNRSSRIPDTVTGGSGRVAVRMPDNILALSLIERSGVPIAAPSANISTRPSISDSRYAIEELGDRVDYIFDCGPTPLGIESTIIDVSGDVPVLLRAGSKSVEELRKIFGDMQVTDVARGLAESPVAITPGMKYRHYAPKKSLILASSIETFLAISSEERFRDTVTLIGSSQACRMAKIPCISLGSEDNLQEVASSVFSSFRELEKTGSRIGIIMPFPEKGLGLAIMNRIRKASSGIIENVSELQNLIDAF